MQRQWLGRDPDPEIAVYVVWSPQLGAQERHVDEATRLIPDARVRHYWDPDSVLGRGYRPLLGTPGAAWDVWLLFGRDARWGSAEAPGPAWWEHQLSGLSPERRLDASRFARRAAALR